MEGLQPWCSAALPIITRCCKSCSCEKSPFTAVGWWGHCTPFTSWLGHGFMEFNATAVHLLTPEVPVCFFLHMCSVCSSLCMKSWGEGPGLFFPEATQRTDPKNLNFCLTSCFLPAQGGVVWSVSVKDGAAEHEWQWLELCCACGRHFQSRWNTADLVSGGEGALLEILAEKALCSLEGAVGVLRPLWPIE